MMGLGTWYILLLFTSPDTSAVVVMLTEAGSL